MGRFEFRIEHDDLEKIKLRARSVNLSTSEFVRQAALQGFIIQYNTIELNRLIWEVNKIGVNINQIAKLCNEAKFVSPKALEKLQEEHGEVWRILFNALVTDDVSKLLKIIARKPVVVEEETY